MVAAIFNSVVAAIFCRCLCDAFVQAHSSGLRSHLYIATYTLGEQLLAMARKILKTSANK